MPEERREARLRESVRGVGYVVALGLFVCLVGLLVAVVSLWVLT